MLNRITSNQYATIPHNSICGVPGSVKKTKSKVGGGELAPSPRRPAIPCHRRGASEKKKKTILDLVTLASTLLAAHLGSLVANMNSEFANFIMCRK